MASHTKQFKKAIALFLVLVMLISISASTAYAGYEGWGPITHIGKYYFKFHHGESALYISKKKSGGYKKTPVDSGFFVSNGKEVMYIGKSGSRSYLKSYDIAKKKVKNIKKLPKKGDIWEVCGAGGKFIWLGCDNRIYRYDVTHKKLNLIKKNAGLYHLKGQYYLYSYGKEKTKKYTYDGGSGVLYGCKEAIYKITKGGKLTKVKSLGRVYEKTDEVYYVENKGKVRQFYYSANGAHDLYKIKTTGKGKKKVASFKGVIVSVYSTHCVIIENEKSYKYVYKTGKKSQVDFVF